MDRVSPLPVVVGDFQFRACNLLWPCSLIETSDRVGFTDRERVVFEVSSQSLKCREAEKMEIAINPYAQPDDT